MLGGFRSVAVGDLLRNPQQWHLDEVFVKINGVTHYLWRAVDHEGEALEVVATKRLIARRRCAF